MAMSERLRTSGRWADDCPTEGVPVQQERPTQMPTTIFQRCLPADVHVRTTPNGTCPVLNKPSFSYYELHIMNFIYTNLISHMSEFWMLKFSRPGACLTSALEDFDGLIGSAIIRGYIGFHWNFQSEIHLASSNRLLVYSARLAYSFSLLFWTIVARLPALPFIEPFDFYPDHQSVVNPLQWIDVSARWYREMNESLVRVLSSNKVQFLLLDGVYQIVSDNDSLLINLEQSTLHSIFNLSAFQCF